MGTKVAWFKTEIEANEFCNKLVDLVRHPLGKPFVAKTEEHGSEKDSDPKYAIKCAHALTTDHVSQAVGELNIDEESNEPAYFQFIAYEPDLGYSAEEYWWHVSMDGKEIWCKAIPT